MKNAVIAAFYALGLSVIFPLLIVNHRSSAALPLFFAPIISAVFAEVLARTVTLTKEMAENRVIWLIAAFLVLSQVAKYALGFKLTDGYIEYLALNALYQIVLVLIFAASERRRTPKAGQTVANGA
jgi:hypothetical protein